MFASRSTVALNIRVAKSGIFYFNTLHADCLSAGWLESRLVVLHEVGERYVSRMSRRRANMIEERMDCGTVMGTTYIFYWSTSRSRSHAQSLLAFSYGSLSCARIPPTMGDVEGKAAVLENTRGGKHSRPLWEYRQIACCENAKPQTGF